MRLRAFSFATAVTLLFFAAYYAGYRHGLDSRPQDTFISESDRIIAPPPGDLAARDLTMPIEGVKPSDLLDTFNQSRGNGKRHEATDIMAPRGTPVHAIEDGSIRKLFLSKAGGITIYEFDPESIYCFYYAHLDHYAAGLHEGQQVKKGDIIGYVGSTGDASEAAPHLHFAIVKLGPGKEWWKGTAINAYPILVQLAAR